MAEVGQRLCGGVHRLSGLRSGHGRPLFSGESPGSRLGLRGADEGRVKEESSRGAREVEPVSGHVTTLSRAEQRYRYRRRKQQQQQGGVSLLCRTTLELDSSRLIGFIQTLARAQAQKSHLQQDKLLPCRMTPWSRRSLSIHPDTFRSHQQVRALCTVLLFLTERGSPDCPQTLRRLKLHPELISRFYSSSDTPLYRTKAAYYEILRVAPGATQAQIKTAYYKQSFIYHPDKNPGNEDASRHFTKISEAYTVLGNVSLRRKYDRGLLNQVDVQTAGRPSPRDAAGRSTGTPHQGRARQFHQAGGKTMFDFDAFYQAHYGEQLRREREMKARREQMEDMQRQKQKKFKEERMMDMTVIIIMVVAGALFAQTLK